MTQPFGILNIHKQAGVTSRDVVNRVQRIVRPAKAGHAGTLDPLATGVLIVCVGPATKLIQHVQRKAKKYTASFLLGQTSDTEDVEGEIVELPDPPRPTRQQIEDALQGFMGEIEQRPPAFSAVKVNGKRAYSLARKGERVELQPRCVKIHGLRLTEFDYPKFTLEIECGSGTYVRSLGRDLGETLQTGAVMCSLVRTAVGQFRVDDACDVETLTFDNLSEFMLPAAEAVSDLPTVELNDDESRRIATGLTIENRFDQNGDEIAAIDKSGQLVSILVPRDTSQLRPVRNLFSR